MCNIAGRPQSTVVDLRIAFRVNYNVELATQRSRQGQMKVISRSRGGQLAPPPPTTMKILHVTTSSGDERSNSSGFKSSSISSLDLKCASAVLIDVEEERFQRQRELPAASVSLSSTAVSTISADDRYRDVLAPSGESRLTLPLRPSIPRRPGPVGLWPRGSRRARAASSPGEQRSGMMMDWDAVMRGAGLDTQATCCSTSSTVAETAINCGLPSADDAPAVADDDALSRDHQDVVFSPLLTRRRCGPPSFSQQCHCPSTSGFVADRKCRSYRKHFAADDRLQPVTKSTTSFQQLPERYINIAELCCTVRLVDYATRTRTYT